MASDNLSPPPAPNRVYYSLGRMLGVDDFQADQDYHRGRLARALVQLCGTGTLAGLNVSIPQLWQANNFYPAFAFVYDANQNVQVNTGTAGTSGSAPPTFATAGSSVNDANGIIWTNEGPVNTAGWRASTLFTYPIAIIDSNNNIQLLNVQPNFTSGSTPPAWNTAIGSTTADGPSAPTAWVCAGPQQLEIAVTPGVAIDRVGRIIEVPRQVCIRIQPWLANQSVASLNSAIHSGNVLADVFATFVPCTSGVTPCFASNDDYSATDAFSANRLLDSFAMQLVLRTEPSPALPLDPWVPGGPAPTSGITAAFTLSVKQSILASKAGAAAEQPFSPSGATPVECPAGMDLSSVFLARVSIPATASTTAGQPPNYNLNEITIDNTSRLFVFPPSLVARSIGLNSGTES
jgi:hypothetical protein